MSPLTCSAVDLRVLRTLTDLVNATRIVKYFAEAAAFNEVEFGQLTNPFRHAERLGIHVFINMVIQPVLKSDGSFTAFSDELLIPSFVRLLLKRCSVAFRSQVFDHFRFTLTEFVREFGRDEFDRTSNA
jgi:hypothetical protein